VQRVNFVFSVSRADAQPYSAPRTEPGIAAHIVAVSQPRAIGMN